MSHTAIALGFTLGLALLTPAADGQVFKCKDEDGKVTYTDVPCLRSETSSVVDTRSNVADHTSLRKEATRLQSNEVTTAPQSSPQPASPRPPPPAPAPASERRASSYR